MALRVLGDLVAARRRIHSAPVERLAEGWQADAAVRSAQDADLRTLEAVRRYANFLLAVLFARRRRRCLPRSLVLFRWAGRLGLNARLHLAIRRDRPDLDGHSWIDLDGEPLFESPDVPDRFASVYDFGPPKG